MVKLVLFDIDGTLIRTGGAGIRAFERTGEHEFQVANGVSHMRFAGRTDTSLVREFFRSHRIPATAENFDRFFGRYVFLLDHFLSLSLGGPCAGVLGFLEELRRLPSPPLLGLQTGNILLGAEIKLRHTRLWDWFQVGAFGDDQEDRNQLAGTARHRGCLALGRELRPEETLVIGDTPSDIECGRSIGARVLAVATGGATLDRLRAHQPDWAVSDLHQVTARAVCG